MPNNHVVERLKRRVTESYRAKKIFFALLKTPLVTCNPIYRSLYKRNILHKIPSMLQKPLFVVIENTNFCNVACVFCANPQMRRTKGFMERKLFERIIDECAGGGIPNVLIQGFGEPLLDKDYLEKVRYAKSKGIEKVHCVTNGILLTEKMSSGLLEAGLDNLYISIDAATEETYGKIHRKPGTGLPSDNFRDVVANIDALVKKKKETGSITPFIEVRFKDFELNRGELRKFVNRYHRVIDRINIYMNITNWPTSTVENNLPQSIPFIKFPCYNIFSTLYVTFDGRVSLCCQDYECQVEIGDLRYQSLLDVWKSPKLAEVRRLHLEDKYASIKVCADCVINTHYVTPWW
jgi:MoaA/NifB/PqqE/SkfB family radical SAM enzyme